MRHAIVAALISGWAVSLAPQTATAAAPCGGPFAPWLEDVKAEARAAGHDAAFVDRFFSGVRPDPKTLEADRAQGVFRRHFSTFSKSLISESRLKTARQKAKELGPLFERLERDYGVSRGIMLAFWAFETDFGKIQGEFNTVNSLATLAHDCRRPELFRPHLLATVDLAAKGALDPRRTTGAWAGEIGMVQMLPADILTRGVDGDGDGKVELKTSVADALLSGARLLQDHGWQAGQPWLQEVVLPAEMDWSLSGLEKPRPTADWTALGLRPREGTLPDLPAALLLPEGRKGPAFLAYPNFNTLFDWNKSLVYVTTTAYFATRILGAPPFLAGTPEAGLQPEQMKLLQQKLAARGHDVGAIDGILGALTRAATQAEQQRLGLPADAWPTQTLLDRL